MLRLNIKKEIATSHFKNIVDALRSGGVVILPTDTVYGLSCLASRAEAIERIYQIKERPQNKAMLVLIKSYCMLHDYFQVSAKQEKYIRSIWPRTTREAQDMAIAAPNAPTTFILEPKGDWIKSSSAVEGIGVRLPKHELLLRLLKAVNEPLISTSLNKSGESPLLSLKDLETKFKTLPDIAVDAGRLPKAKPSRIVDIRDMDNIAVIR